jgi:flagellar biosynthesis/type III secretory pathway protein FliH
VGRGGALSNIIRQCHAVVHNIQPFTILEAAVEPPTPAPRPVVPGSVITRADTYPVPVRLFDFYGHPANADASPRSEIEPESDTRGSSTVAMEPEITAPPAEPTALDEAAAMQGEAAHAAHAAAAGLTRERERVLQEARDEAARCLARAQEQAAALTTVAYEQGVRQGEEAARQTLTTQLSPVLNAFQQATTEIAYLRVAVLRQAEEDIVTLAFQLAHKIIQREVQEHREVLATTLKRALAHVVEQDQVVVRVHPDDLHYVTEIKEELGQARGDIKTLMVQGNASVGRGGCLVESSLGTIDARIEAQFDELEQRFRAQHFLDLEARVA